MTYAGTKAGASGAGGMTDDATGTHTADGTEQTVFTLDPSTSGVVFYAIDLSNMQAGDTVVLREKMDPDDDGTYSQHNSETLSDAQTNDIITPSGEFIVMDTVPFRLTLEQTAGTNRTFDYAHGVLH